MVFKSIVMFYYSLSMLSDVLILVMWPKWVDKHLLQVSKDVFSWEKPYKDFLILLKQKIFLH